MNAFDRNSNLTIIEKLWNSEKIVLNDYIEKILIPLKNKNPNFLETLYKDILYVLDGLDKPNENEDFVNENSDIKLSGYQTGLHDLCIWLHQEFIEDNLAHLDNLNNMTEACEKAEKKLLKRDNLTTEYRGKLEEIKRSLGKESKVNYANK